VPGQEDYMFLPRIGRSRAARSAVISGIE